MITNIENFMINPNCYKSKIFLLNQKYLKDVSSFEFFRNNSKSQNKFKINSRTNLSKESNKIKISFDECTRDEYTARQNKLIHREKKNKKLKKLFRVDKNLKFKHYINEHNNNNILNFDLNEFSTNLNLNKVHSNDLINDIQRKCNYINDKATMDLEEIIDCKFERISTVSTQDTMSKKSENNIEFFSREKNSFNCLFNYNLCIKTVNDRGISKINELNENYPFLKQIINSKKCINREIITKVQMNDIFSDMFEEEKTNRISQPLYYYIIKQTDVNEKMRAVVIDWLVDVHHKFKLNSETLFMTIGLIDRYLSVKQCSPNKLQLLGVSAMWIACKYEEIVCPIIKDLVYITDDSYSKNDILKMEKDILITLNYFVTFPVSILCFYDLLALNFCFTIEDYYLGKYFIETSFLDLTISKYKCSLVACSIIYLVMKLKRNNYPNYNLIYGYTNENETVLKECAKNIHYVITQIDLCNLHAVKKKYALDEYFRVSEFAIPSN